MPGPTQDAAPLAAELDCLLAVGFLKTPDLQLVGVLAGGRSAIMHARSLSCSRSSSVIDVAM
jgi:hypothetical protein